MLEKLVRHVVTRNLELLSRLLPGRCYPNGLNAPRVGPKAIVLVLDALQPILSERN